MTTPLSATSRSAERGPNRTPAGAGLVAQARVRAVLYVLVDGTPA
ncbi:hypothetical protein ACH4M4_27285 [Streptomyces sp. NPDC017254]